MSGSSDPEVPFMPQLDPSSVALVILHFFGFFFDYFHKHSLFKVSPRCQKVMKNTISFWSPSHQPHNEKTSTITSINTKKTKNSNKKKQLAERLQSENLDSTNDSNPLKGWLKKKGDRGIIKSWRNRWFEEKEGTLAYYRQRDDNEALGVIELGSVCDIRQTNDGAFGFAFSVPGRVYFLQAFSETERDEWLTGLVNRTGLELGNPAEKPRTAKKRTQSTLANSNSVNSVSTGWFF